MSLLTHENMHYLLQIHVKPKQTSQTNCKIAIPAPSCVLSASKINYLVAVF